MSNDTSIAMEKRRLGTSDLHITPVGFGAWAIGGNWAFGWGDQDDGDSVAAIRRALERGINWIDTAHAYGWGHSESVVAQALADIAPSERPYVFTKCALVPDGKGGTTESLDPASLRAECEASLTRLGVTSTPAGQRSPTSSAKAKCARSASRISASQKWSGRARSRRLPRYSRRIVRSNAKSKPTFCRIAKRTTSA